MLFSFICLWLAAISCATTRKCVGFLSLTKNNDDSSKKLWQTKKRFFLRIQHTTIVALPVVSERKLFEQVLICTLYVFVYKATESSKLKNFLSKRDRNVVYWKLPAQGTETMRKSTFVVMLRIAVCALVILVIWILFGVM